MMEDLLVTEGHSFASPKEMLEAARKARIELCVFAHDAQVPGEVAALSRALYMHIPEFAKRHGEQLQDKEGHPEGITAREEALPKMIADDLGQSRDIASWLSAVTSPVTKSMFAQGRDNALDAMFERFAQEKGFERNDRLSQEAVGAAPGPDVRADVSRPMDDRIGPKPPISAFAAYAAQRSMG